MENSLEAARKSFSQRRWTPEQQSFLRSPEGKTFCLYIQENYLRIAYGQELVRRAIRTGIFLIGQFFRANPEKSDRPWNNMMREIAERMGMFGEEEELEIGQTFVDGNEPNPEVIRWFDQLMSARLQLMREILTYGEHDAENGASLAAAL